LLAQAIALHQGGWLAEAELRYRAILEREPADFDSLHLLGVILQQRGDHAGAVQLIDRALAINPGIAIAHNNRAVALLDLARFEEALASCDRARSIDPANPKIWFHRALALFTLRRFAEALSDTEAALAIQPRYPGALNHRGKVMERLDRPEEALAS